MNDPFRLSSAMTIRTEAYLRTGHAVQTAIERQLIVLVVGDGGTGKTFAIEDALASVANEPLLIWQAQQRLTPKQTALSLLKVATGVDYEREGRYAVFERLERWLSEHPRLLWVDEADALRPEGLDVLRHVWLSQKTSGGIVLSGGPMLLDRVQNNQMLNRRVVEVVGFQPLTPEEVQTEIPGWHPLFARCEPRLLDDINRRWAHGYLGLFASFVLQVEPILRRTGRRALDRAVVDAVVSVRQGLTMSKQAAAVAQKRQRVDGPRRRAPRRR